MGKGLLFFGLLIVVAIAAIAGLLYRPATLIGASDKSLAYSIRKEADSNKASCRGDGDRFTCVVASGGASRYDVSVDDYGCWDAATKGAKGSGKGKGSGSSLSGCITVVDLIRLDD